MSEFICCFCESEMDAEQIICCDTYKGKMTVAEYESVYGYMFEDLSYEYQDYELQEC